MIARRPRRRIILLVGLAFLVAGVAIVLRASSTARPQAFYAAPSPLPRGPSGTILRKELIKNFYPGAKTYRCLLYTSPSPRD